ncbi:MAG: D-glycero-beta-D-manno-heptose 1-phosphate adenylyltransferase [Candidatus Euphemobacter frigidus]|nr:D-glycero-beta-D-manno-heptose 1-phosphate adenylyltransferase [Candidatus Euphemobacter frigidus]MDP8274929.1 D-glycero-beta-D-manno-heptose 1-phosphate adenylyltransferase [Candidatus Euphemobacter frigidus]
MKKKIIKRGELPGVLSPIKSRGKKIVFTNGCFDLLHIGHIRYLGKARAEGDVLVVGLNSDRSVRGLKGENRPLIPEAERAELLAALSMVDFIVIFDEPTPLELIKEVRPDVLVKGGDWKKEDIVGGSEVEASGGKVVVVPEIPGKSTSDLISEIVRKSRSGIEI